MTEAPPDFAQNRHLRQGGVTSRLQNYAYMPTLNTALSDPDFGIGGY